MTELGSMGCLVCGGSGVGAFARPCTACGGTGRVAVKFRADVAAASERLTDGELQVFINADPDGRGTIANMARELLSLRAELDAARERVQALEAENARLNKALNEVDDAMMYLSDMGGVD